ncbi:hypothetical protein [Caminibacter pacificus]|uniref:Uncharacterized protein n=1 Tax=Caminibacter pacificus TaxID=1424653 RepID=A0AAJ4UX63_9BACT|nr:hypothetical protein [Caminibacter pacificus]QDD68153.1 hypothetical protein C6V80_09880 [Caminibacter pacificus]ROR38771.1 hypothetical protein EDC58_1986 [Caminibacter pacificus]
MKLRKLQALGVLDTPEASKKQKNKADKKTEKKKEKIKEEVIKKKSPLKKILIIIGLIIAAFVGFVALVKFIGVNEILAEANKQTKINKPLKKEKEVKVVQAPQTPPPPKNDEKNKKYAAAGAIEKVEVSDINTTDNNKSAVIDLNKLQNNTQNVQTKPQIKYVTKTKCILKQDLDNLVYFYKIGSILEPIWKNPEWNGKGITLPKGFFIFPKKEDIQGKYIKIDEKHNIFIPKKYFICSEVKVKENDNGN